MHTTPVRGFPWSSLLPAGLVPVVPGAVKLLGGLIFPVGLTLVVLSGAELYTGNTAVLPMSLYERQATLGGLLHNWFWSYFGNFVGSLMVRGAWRQSPKRAERATHWRGALWSLAPQHAAKRLQVVGRSLWGGCGGRCPTRAPSRLRPASLLRAAPGRGAQCPRTCNA